MANVAQYGKDKLEAIMNCEESFEIPSYLHKSSWWSWEQTKVAKSAYMYVRLFVI